MVIRNFNYDSAGPGQWVGLLFMFDGRKSQVSLVRLVGAGLSEPHLVMPMSLLSLFMSLMKSTVTVSVKLIPVNALMTNTRYSVE